MPVRTVLLLTLLLGLTDIVKGQIGVTTCTFATQALCAANIPLSYCDVAAGRCKCATVAGYVDDGTGFACTYECGALTSPTNGGVSTAQGTNTGDIATYSCNNGYKLVGSSTRTCVQDTGWNGAAPTCTQGVIGDSCASNTNLCILITFGTCAASTCQCLPGYENDGTNTKCKEINECVTLTPCTNGGTCTDGINSYTCACVAGYTGTNCSTNINECASAPCQNGGTCNDMINSYTCTCAAGYTGTTCATNINECSSTPCQNGGSCTDLVNGYTCTCVAGYTGTTCATNINECASNPCQNGGTCTDLVNNYSCACVAGYTDKNCQTNINECIGNLCQNGATCVDGINQYTCNCVAGYNGTLCSNNINDCAVHNCSNGATCVDGVNKFTCTCAPGFNGTYCTNNIDECVPVPCVNGGTCIDGINDYTCNCVAGYTGKTCATNINECASSPCQNGGTCTDLINNYSCACVAGYTDKNCQTNINECASSPCQNGGTCTDLINNYACSCVAGYTDKNCQTNINECIGNVCQNGATCVDQINQYACLCVAGYNGTFCNNNINECVGHSCQNGGACVDGINTYSCVCAPGYNGTFCTNNINECIPLPCVNGGSCVDGVNDYTCNCVAGYSGKNCATNINECSSAPCQNGGTCVDAVNNYTCNCLPGYTDKNCQTNIDECVTNNCKNGATCVDGINGYSCVCAQGYNGVFCTNNINECVGNVCQNGAYCIDKVNGYTCECLLGYDGTFCQNNINECANHTCQNGATCVDGINGYSCTCMPGYNGNLCQLNINECASHGCVNGATCVDEINKYTCTCVAGYTGTLCSTNINECSSSPCKNGGTCVDAVNDYSCNCVAGYTDKNCQTNINECASAPCQNNGTCVDAVNDYSCLCVDGYTGKNCATNINECSSDPCQNGATCTDLVNGYTCTCIAGYNGVRCQTNINECLSHSCVNGATCVDGINKYTCTCVAGYDGTYCQNNINECATHNCKNGATCVDGINAYTCICVSGYTDTYCGTNINECASNPCLNGGTCTDNVNGYTCSCANGFTGLTCRPGVLGDSCSPRPVVCNNLAYANCNGSVCVCNTGYQDAGATGSCSRINCGSITPPVNGAVNHSEGTLYESKAYFSCNAGYTLNGLSSVTCQADKTWNGATPICVIKDCGTLSATLNGAVGFTPNTLYLGSAEFSCNVGYNLNGSATRTCQSSGVWGGSSPVCKIKDCGSINPPSNGALDQTDGTTYLSVVTFRCNTGYTLVGSSSLKCQADATWDGAKPACNIKDCGFLTDPVNGLLNQTQGTEYLATAFFYCNTGYTLVGSSTRICQASGVWSTVSPVCQINDCGVLSDPANGDVNINAGTTYGKVATYSCNPGFELQGVTQRTCQANKVWSSTAPTCARLNCGTLNAPKNGLVDLSAGTLFEATATFQCNPGYTLTGFSTRDCTTAGTWDNASPTCVIKDCGILTSPVHGYVLTEHGTEYNATAVYSCIKGYEVNGVSSRVCQTDGIWSASNPTCVIKDCGPVALITNGDISYSNGTVYGSTVSYKCDDGYEVTGVSTRVCLSTGVWDDVQPLCTILSCDDAIVIPHGVARTPSGSQVGDLAIYECISGYGLVGNPNVECKPSGFWGTVPECRLDCGNPPTVAHGSYTYANGTLVGAGAVYTCDSGYYISGQATVTCQSFGAWSTEPSCLIILIDYNTTCTVTAQCKTTGATCRDDGHGADRCLCSLLTQHFDPVTDECLAVCGGLPAPTNGKIALPSVYAAGQSAVYTCDRGYSLTGPATRTCLPAGYWNSSAPQCTTGCPYPTAPKNGHVDASRGTASGNTITYSCNDGYALIGAAQRRCNSDAKWNGHEPVCKIECPKLLDIENGKVDLSLGTFEGSKAVYVCKTTYAIVGESTRTCQSSGVWDGVQPSCVFAIFPDVILVFGSLFVFLVLIDVFVLGFCVYIRYFQKKPDMPSADIDEPQKDLKKEKRKKKDYPDTLNDEEKGVPPSSHRHSSKEHRDRKEKEKQERRTRAANRTVPDTRQEILPTDHHPPPQNGPNVRIERNPYLGFDKPKFLKSLTKSRSKPPTKENDYGLDLTELTKVEDMQFTSLDTPQAPPSSEQRANKGFGEETADHVHLDELVKDGGYGTANSDESNARIHFDDRLSLEDLTPAGPVPDPPVITLKETKKPTDEFTDTFKGRTDLRPMSARVEAERDGEKPHTTRDRRHLMNLLNTDSEI